MEYGQPWVPQRPSARPGVGFRPNPPIGSQRIQQPNGTGQNGVSTLSREERQEANAWQRKQISVSLGTRWYDASLSLTALIRP